MAGTFEIIREGEGTFLFRLTAGDGAVVAVSPRFTTIKAVVDGITAVRENAATGLVVDHSSSAPLLPREEHAGPGSKAVMAA
jgi:uncharacterized protein YegP (UPF0339 family)